MIRLRIGYLISGIITGLFLVLSFFATIPDGKLHIVFCDVGQGDGIYIRYPDGKDMVVDGGPGNQIIGCLSRHMPFWDRTIDLALLTHPDTDHLNGLLAVLERYHINHFVRSDVQTPSEGFETLKKVIQQKNITERLVTTGETISVGPAVMTIVWPSKEQIAFMKPLPNVLGFATQTPKVGVNDASIVFFLSYGMFDALFTGDADSLIQPRMLPLIPRSRPSLDGHQRPGLWADGILELLKVPHHGSKTGMTDAFLKAVNSRPGLGSYSLPKNPLAVISVGRNSYGHPAPEVITRLEQAGFQVLRTDTAGDIEVVSDGIMWVVKEN